MTDSPKNGSSALLRALGTIDDRGGIHDRFMPDLVLDIRAELQALGYDVVRAASPETPEAGIDVERLARAMKQLRHDKVSPEMRAQGGWTMLTERDAETIAAEYARLASREEDPENIENRRERARREENGL